MRRKLRLIVNPSASAVSPRTRVVIRQKLAAQHEVSTVLTTRSHHAALLAARAASDGVDALFVLGGDGTLNEAANGLAGSSTALAPLPGGSTNVFARTLGLPDDPIDAVEAMLAALNARSMLSIGLGSVNWRYFLLHAGFGFDAAVVERVERRDALKPSLNHALFLWETFSTWLWHFDRECPHFRVELPDIPAPASPGARLVSASAAPGARLVSASAAPGARLVSASAASSYDDGYFAVFLNSNPYTYLGSRQFSLSREATLRSPLVMVSVKQFTVGALLRLAYEALRSPGGLTSSALVDHVSGVTQANVVGYRAVPVQLDGEFVGCYESLRIAYHPQILRVVLPPAGFRA